MKKLFIMLLCPLMLAACGGGSSTTPSPIVSDPASQGNGFTTSMVSGKSFKYATDTGKAGSITFNSISNSIYTYTDVLIGGVPITGTWSINSTGQMVTVDSTGTSTLTMTMSSSTLIAANKINGNTSSTVTFVLSDGFTPSMVVGKTIYEAKGPTLSAPQASSYMRLQFNSDGSLQTSGGVTSGTPTLGYSAHWATVGSTLQLLNFPDISSMTSVVFLSEDTANRFWRVQNNSGITRYYYDQSTAQAQAQTFAASNAMP